MVTEDCVTDLLVVRENLLLIAEGSGPLQIFDMEKNKMVMKKKMKELKYVKGMYRTNNANEIAICTEKRGLWFFELSETDGKLGHVLPLTLPLFYQVG